MEKERIHQQILEEAKIEQVVLEELPSEEEVAEVVEDMETKEEEQVTEQVVVEQTMVLSQMLPKKNGKKRKQDAPAERQSDKIMLLNESQIGASGNSSSNKNKRSKRKHKVSINNVPQEEQKSSSPAIFDPFSEIIIDPQLKRKDPRINLRPKSSTKQMSFKK